MKSGENWSSAMQNLINRDCDNNGQYTSDTKIEVFYLKRIRFELSTFARSNFNINFRFNLYHYVISTCEKLST